MTSAPILELQSISKSFASSLFRPKQKAISGLSFTCSEGQCIGLLGHNGAGKTTTIKTILGLLRPDSGSIYFRQKPMNHNHRQHLGYMPETNKLAQTLSATEILQFQLRYYDRSTDITLINNMLQKLDLWDHRHKKLKTLSKGLCRRVAWAQATIHDPALMILDEPFSGLDPLGRELLTDSIKNLKKRKKTIILCSHELGSIINLCDDILILNQGKLVFSSKDLLDSHSIRQYFIKVQPSESALPPMKWEKTSSGEWISYFPDYELAKKSLCYCMDKNILIHSFGKCSRFTEAFLIDFFHTTKNKKE